MKESDESEAMKTFLLFESGHCGHLTLAQFKQAVIEMETYDQVIVKGGNLKMSHFLFTLGVFNLNYLW